MATADTESEDGLVQRIARETHKLIESSRIQEYGAYLRSQSFVLAYNRFPPGILANIPIISDTVRIMTLYELAREINNRSLPGHIAEVGVNKGIFAKYISRYFPGRSFYLFDTFDGFPEDQLHHDRQHYGTASSSASKFKDTSVQVALKMVVDPERCIVRKGVFPETAAGLEEERFAFVSLDADLYIPTLAGLEFFYPRMVSGGYIMVHDFGAREFTGCADAIKKYCRDQGIAYIPVADHLCSCIIAKP